MSRPLRLPNFHYKGLYRYFLTACCFNRQTLLAHADTVTDTLAQFRRTSNDEAFEILAYCIMPDHVHFLVEGVEARSDFRRFCKLAKQRSGTVHARSYGGPLWQEGYHERVLRENEDLRALARYLLNNPVRAGLVASPLDYPYLGSDRWTLEELIDAQQM